MKYHCLVNVDEQRPGGLPDEDCIASEVLESVHCATTVRMRNGKLSVADGPFAETKEQLGGFYMIEATDLNDAIQIAARIPPARVGCVEVGPTKPIRESVARAGAARQLQT